MTDLNTPEEALFVQEEVRKNFIKSGILIGILMLLVLGLSWMIGRFCNDISMGLMIGVVVCVIVIPLQIMTGKIMILSMSRGRKPNMENLRERRAVQLLQGLSIAAGLKKTPELYIVPSQVPNAFASGMNEEEAFVGVTEGLLEMMDDQELEGVLGHEVSHIVHRDIMLNQLVVALISVILILVLIMERIGIFSALTGGSRDRENRSGGAGAVILVVLLVALIIRPVAILLSTLLQCSISRQREYAADAYAVRLCSYNEGLARALEKLGGRKRPYTRQEAESLGGQEMACMYINYPGEHLFSTHPPI